MTRRNEILATPKERSCEWSDGFDSATVLGIARFHLARAAHRDFRVCDGAAGHQRRVLRRDAVAEQNFPDDRTGPACPTNRRYHQTRLTRDRHSRWNTF